MTPQQREQDLWQRAAPDLGIEFVCPFRLADGSNTFSYVGLVPNFGSKRGTAIITGEDLAK